MMKKVLALILTLMLLLPAALAEETPYTVTAPAAATVTFTFEGGMQDGFLGTLDIKNGSVVTLDHMAWQNNTYTFTLKAAAPGEAIVVFQYGKPMEHYVEKQQAFLVMVLENGTVEVQDLSEQLPMTGTVKEVTEEGVLLETLEQGDVLCRLPEGMPAPAENDLIQVWFNGVMTMSLPGQINVLAWEHVSMQAR